MKQLLLLAQIHKMILSWSKMDLKTNLEKRKIQKKEKRETCYWAVSPLLGSRPNRKAGLACFRLASRARTAPGDDRARPPHGRHASATAPRRRQPGLSRPKPRSLSSLCHLRPCSPALSLSRLAQQQQFGCTIIESRMRLGPCLVSKKFCKIFQIPRHIESLYVCMKY